MSRYEYWFIRHLCPTIFQIVMATTSWFAEKTLASSGLYVQKTEFESAGYGNVNPLTWRQTKVP